MKACGLCDDLALDCAEQQKSFGAEGVIRLAQYFSNNVGGKREKSPFAFSLVIPTEDHMEF